MEKKYAFANFFPKIVKIKIKIIFQITMKLLTFFL